MNKLPVIGVGQARQLAGKSLRAGNRDFAFGNKESIRLGGQAVAIPLLDTSGRKVAFFRSSIALAATPAKIQRTSWLVGQRLHLKNDVFNAAPQLWFTLRFMVGRTVLSLTWLQRFTVVRPGNRGKTGRRKLSSERWMLLRSINA